MWKLIQRITPNKYHDSNNAIPLIRNKYELTFDDQVILDLKRKLVSKIKNIQFDVI